MRKIERNFEVWMNVNGFYRIVIVILFYIVIKMFYWFIICELEVWFDKIIVWIYSNFKINLFGILLEDNNYWVG